MQSPQAEKSNPPVKVEQRGRIYCDPSHATFTVNYIVDDLDALFDRLKQEGLKIDAETHG